MINVQKGVNIEIITSLHNFLLGRDEQILFGDSETKRFNAVETVEVGGVVWENPDVWRKRDDYCSEMGKYWNSTSLHNF